MPNHLLGYRRTFFELRFANVSDLLAARRDIMPIAEKNKKNMNAMDTYAEVARYVFAAGKMWCLTDADYIRETKHIVKLNHVIDKYECQVNILNGEKCEK